MKKQGYAGFWKRFVAYLIDKCIIVGVILIFNLVHSFEKNNFFSGFIFYCLLIFGTWLYFAIMESSSYQATLGKMVMKIVVTDYKGKRLSFGRATGRYFAKILSGLILDVGFFMAGWTQNKQGLHDMIAETYVVNKK